MTMPPNKAEDPYVGKPRIDYAQAEQTVELCQKGNYGISCINEYPTPTTHIPHYTDPEGIVVSNELSNADTFQRALCVLIAWLERGECNKETSDIFFSMIRSTANHVRRLLDEKAKCIRKLNKAECEIGQKRQTVLMQLNEIQKVLATAYTESVLDNFTEIQRKNVEMWKKQIENQLNEYMDVSDSDITQNANADVKYNSTVQQQVDNLKEAICELQDEHEVLLSRIEAVENENMALRAKLAEKKYIKVNIKK